MARIVVAEDDAHVLRLLSMWLARNGHEVLEARDGAEAQSLLQHGDVACLVCDVNMPVMDGIELVQWLRHEAKQEIPVLVLSARCDQARFGEILSGYRTSIHPKPFSPSRLITEIEHRLSETADAETKACRP